MGDHNSGFRKGSDFIDRGDRIDGDGRNGAGIRERAALEARGVIAAIA
jgi:hypothetical protein